MKFPHLFSPLKIGNKIAANRIESAPMSVVDLTPEGYFTAENIAHYEARAKGGAGIVTLGESLVHPTGNSHGRMVALYDPQCLPSMITAFEAVKRHGALASIQLIHAGMRANPKYCPDGIVYGPSPVENYTYDNSITELDEDMIATLVEAFGDAAKMAKFAGADMIMVHGGHGWLLAQFLSPLSNHRTDRFGGSLENRARLSLMVIENIRQKCGPDFPIEFRMSGDELYEGGMTQEEGIELAKLLDGKVDILHVSATTFLDKEASIRMFPTIFAEHGRNVYLAAAIKKVVKKSLVTTLGALGDPAQLEQIIADGQADIVAVGRGLLADPELPRKALLGQDEEIRPCIRCMYCISNNFVPYIPYATMLMRCTVNPVTGRELDLRSYPPAGKAKKVLVVGGGPGGMQAAITAADRGHTVTLCEKESQLGGALRYAVHPQFKDDLKKYTDYLIRQVENRQIKVRLNTEVTPEYARSQQADLIIAALGASPILPKIPGIDGQQVYLAAQLPPHNEIPGQKIVVVGGGLVGCEEALSLAQEGREVVLLEQLDAVAADAPVIHWKALNKEIRNTPNLEVKLNTTCLEITPNGVKIRDAAGQEQVLPAEAVLIAVGLRSNQEATETLRGCAPQFRLVGDCKQPAKVTEAIFDAYFAALDC